MTRIVTWLAFITLAFACGKPGPVAYFPPHAFATDAAVDTFLSEWFSKHLSAMNEPSLAAYDRPSNVVRLLYLRTFHHPIAVRVEFSSAGGKLFATELDGAGGYEPGRVLRRVARDLTAVEAGALLPQMARIWDMPPIVPKHGFDGSRWNVEVATSERYHVVTRWSPSNADAPEYRAFCMRLLELGSMTPAKKLY